MKSETPKSDSGAAVVEAALIIPLPVLLTIGVVDLGRAFFDSAKVQEAAQEGAYYASLNPDDPSEAIARAQETIEGVSFTGSIVITCPAPDQVTVTVTHTHDVIAPIVSNIVGNTLDLTHVQTAQVLTSDPCTPSA